MKMMVKLTMDDVPYSAAIDQDVLYVRTVVRAQGAPVNVTSSRPSERHGITVADFHEAHKCSTAL